MPETRRQRRQAGFSLIELSIVLIISGILVSFGLKTTAAYMETEARKTTKERLAAIEEALVLFATKQKRLPCPADGALAATSAASGDEQLQTAGDTTTCKVGIQYSVVPWRALGITQEVAYDGWRRKITYRADDGAGGLTRTNGLDMNDCLAAGNTIAFPTTPATYSCPAATSTTSYRPIAFLKTKGLTVNNGDPAMKLMDPGPASDSGGAAFVLVSHGKDGLGAYLPGGTRMALPPAGQVAQTDNTNDATQFADAPRNENTTSSTYFDDIVARRSIDWVATRAGIGPQ